MGRADGRETVDAQPGRKDALLPWPHSNEAARGEQVSSCATLPLPIRARGSHQVNRENFMRSMLIALVAAVCVTTAHAQAKNPVLVFQHVTVIDVKAGTPIPDQTVVVQNGRITTV